MIESITTKLKMTAFVESRQGGRSENQDFAGAAETSFGTLIIVCDGMGGMQGGSVASRIGVTTILEYVQQADPQENAKMVLVKAIQRANQAVLEEGEANPSLNGMGTTVTALLINDRQAVVAHVGDSRVYQLRKGKKVFRTFDHSMVFEMVRKKVITEEQARLSAQSNIIMRALGIKDNVEVDTQILSYRKGDRFVLCTDGFWGVMPEEEFISMLSSDKAVDQLLQAACDQVESMAGKKGSDYDNLTAVIAEVEQDSLIQPRSSRRRMMIAGGSVALVLLAGTGAWLATQHSSCDKMLLQATEQKDTGQSPVDATKIDSDKIVTDVDSVSGDSIA